MNPLQPTPMTVVGLEIDNFKRLRAVRLTPSPTGLILVRGRNEQGKSSVIDSMAASIGGAEETDELPIHEGEHTARTLVNLGEIVIRKKWTRDSGGKAKASLVVEGADGVPVKSPQAVLDMLRSKTADPVRFMAMTPKEQTETVLTVLGLDAELRRLESLEKEQFDYRTVVGRDADRAAKAAAKLGEEIQGLPIHVATGNVNELTAQLQAARDHNEQFDATRRLKQSAEDAGRQAAARVARLQAELAHAESEAAHHRQVWTDAHAELQASSPVDVEPIVDALRSIEESQRNNAKLELFESAKDDAVRADALHAEAEAAIAETRASIAALLGNAQFPIAGMTYDPDAKRLTVDGIPLAQCSHAQRLKISVSIAMAGAPAIKVIFIRDGSMLDDESLALVAQWADESKFQVWCERVDSQREGAGVWVEDGEAFADEELAP